MMDAHEFQTEVTTINRSTTVERTLDDFLAKCLSENHQIDSPRDATRMLLEMYLAVVRSRNKVRRNWHPKLARACDLQTLAWIKNKKAFKSQVMQKLQEALTITSKGDRVILEESLTELTTKIADAIYKREPKKPRPSPLEKIVKRALAENPEATVTEVIQRMRSSKKEFGIVDIDDTTVVIEIEQGNGRQIRKISRSLSTIGNILSKLKNHKKQSGLKKSRSA